jgi:hypothetical protein
MRHKKDRGNAKQVSPPERARRQRQGLATLQQISQEDNVPYTSVRDLVLRGKLPKVQLGDSRRIWVKWSDWDRLVERSTTTMAAE